LGWTEEFIPFAHRHPHGSYASKTVTPGDAMLQRVPYPEPDMTRFDRVELDRETHPLGRDGRAKASHGARWGRGDLDEGDQVAGIGAETGNAVRSSSYQPPVVGTTKSDSIVGGPNGGGAMITFNAHDPEQLVGLARRMRIPTEDAV